MRDIKELARQVKMPYDFVTGEPINIEKLEAFANLVRADALAEHPAYRAVKTFHEGKPVYVAEQPAQQEPVAMRDAIVANLVREGINKHRARELADHFIGLATARPTVPDALTAADKESPEYTDGWNDCRQAMLAS